ncbi:MAG: FHA domain-containing protein [Oligoflexia bacterium]|nr:FHA domain-containing protein [Oligoflexia bacterium]
MATDGEQINGSAALEHELLDQESEAVEGDAALNEEPAPYIADSTTRARKATITLCSGATKRVRSFLDEDSIPDEDGSWISVSQTRSAGNGGERSAPGPLPKFQRLNRHGSTTRGEGMEPGLVNYLASSGMAGEVADPLAPIVGFMVSFDANPSGEAYVLRSGRWIITSAPVALPNSTIVISDSSIAPMHATLSISSAGEIKVLDQFSVTGTWVKRAGSESEEKIVDAAASIAHGDVLRLGNRNFHVSLIR